MIVTFSEEIRDAVEVIMRAPTTDQIKVINVLLRNQAINNDIGVVGRGFLGDANQYIRAALLHRYWDQGRSSERRQRCLK